MKWIGSSGTWRTTNEQVERDVRAAQVSIHSYNTTRDRSYGDLTPGL